MVTRLNDRVIGIGFNGRCLSGHYNNVVCFLRQVAPHSLRREAWDSAAAEIRHRPVACWEQERGLYILTLTSGVFVVVVIVVIK